MIGHLTVDELKKRMDEGKRPFLLDVRENFEREICKLEDDLHIPMKEIPKRLNDLDKTKEVVVYCRSGGRSLQVCNWLSQQGFEKVVNLKGGVLAWADQVDSSMPKY